jgi:hypothetical protein
MLFFQGAELRSIGTDLLQTKLGPREFIAAMARLRLRDAGQDARRDLADGNRDLYCVGTIACWPPGVHEDIPAGFSILATATTGCVIAGGDLEMTYREEEERYVAAYNEAKLAAFRSRGAVRGAALSKAP